ncbi:vacuolar Zn-iron permease [Scheffersomyces coipomensis]|uniref:vacuolar Zn-iron permease n=1 Tax=Scheffersomyces coipomensis TaxID=1788519 RepID=UPI00315D2E6F
MTFPPVNYPEDWSQGWYLTFLSSCMCLLGCLIIYLDDLYYLLLPKFITSRYPFHLKENYTFLNASLAFSAGCLLFTSLFRLLPEALQYLKNSIQDEDDLTPLPVNVERRLQFDLIVSYIIGAAICVSFNTILHLITSESVVHCNHGDHDDEEAELINNDIHDKGKIQEAHSHSHHEQHQHHEESNSSPRKYHHHHHHHTHSNEDHDIDPKDTQTRKPSDPNSPEFGDSSDTYSTSSNPQECQGTKSSCQTQIEDHDESTPLIENQKSIKQRKSIIHYFSLHLDDSDDVGECKGYSSAELCLFNKHHAVNIDPTQTQLHFCELPELNRTQSDLATATYGAIDSSNFTNGGEVLIDPFHHPIHHSISHASHNNESHHNNQSLNHGEHKSDHHHHINTPLSRLLLIGIQTTLAITLHKLPEGFITYITSETNPELGVSIFLSLLLHNFTEGFSMCLPLYYSFTAGSSKNYAKLKAIGISGLLGGLAQPLGALLGYLFIAYNKNRLSDGSGDDDEIIDMQSLNFIFGITLSITSSFLTVIGLSMYGSAVAFGGSLNSVLIWCIIGISVIGLSSIAID